jgi:hypothetical protein
VIFKKSAKGSEPGVKIGRTWISVVVPAYVGIDEYWISICGTQFKEFGIILNAQASSWEQARRRA